jgi:uncharacterized protein (TIGR02145 family)
MKNKILLLLIVLVTGVNAQTYMSVNFKNGNATTFSVDSIDSIVYHSTTCPVLTDVDGNNYSVVAIGNRCWMKENLRTTHYNDGSSISTGLSNADWQTTTIGAYADYNNDTAISSVYGRLYNWYAVANPSGLCPTGWHVMNEFDWNYLIKFIDLTADTTCNGCFQGSTVGGSMKETGLSHWITPNSGATNSSGFTGLAAGFRDNYGSYMDLGVLGYWQSANQYSSTDSYYHALYYNKTNIFKSFIKKAYGVSVRCAQD